MVQQVHVKYFKRFRDQVFDLSDHLVLAGPNNSGKTTLLQAIVVWGLALQKWKERRGPESGSKATKRKGIPLTRQDFTALPLRLMEHLYTDTITGLTKDELGEDEKQGEPRVLEITLEEVKGDAPWRLGFQFRYSSTEQLYVQPVEERIPEQAEALTVVHVPPFSGIGHAEPRMDRPLQDLLIGQGKAGDILRNLLLEVYQKDREKWKELCEQVSELFKVDLEPPEYAGTPHIICEFVPQDTPARRGRAKTRFDVASAGSGFHQVLLLLGFFYARPSTLVLLDEPDAHLHVLLQKQIYDTIRRVASKQRSQVLIATHSEVLLDNTAPTQILSFYGTPHALRVHPERDQVREALKRLSAGDMLLAEKAKGVLYLEDQTDADLLRTWAKIVRHRLADWFADRPLLQFMHGRRPREAKAHFFALRAVAPSIRAFVLLDGDNRNEPDSEVAAEGVLLARWRRYEAESYLVHPEALRRYSSTHASVLMAEQGDRYLELNMGGPLYRNPLQESEYWSSTPASKTLLPGYFGETRVELPKNEYFLFAESMQANEIPDEVREKLDSIAETVMDSQAQE